MPNSTSVAGWAERRSPPDVAYTFWLGAATAGLRTAWPNVPLVSRAHGGDLYPHAHGWGSIPFQKAALRSVDLLAAVSSNGREDLARRHPEVEAALTVRHLGIHDLGGLAPTSRNSALRLLSVSSIDPNKRVPLIWEVACELARWGRAIEWTHIGDGPGRAELHTLVAGGPSSLTASLRGFVPLEEVHRELCSGGHDIFVNLSLSEGAPVSLMEAQCVGMPVLSPPPSGARPRSPLDTSMPWSPSKMGSTRWPARL